jgi:desulfoferrodoxin (superoxide reductase-like protein)
MFSPTFLVDVAVTVGFEVSHCRDYEGYIYWCMAPCSLVVFYYSLIELQVGFYLVAVQ